jgi:hypothetical protein
MVRLALALAFAAMLAAGLPWPGLFLAIGLGVSAIGCGWLAYSRPGAAGGARIGAAAAITVGTIGFLLGTARVVMVLAAISRIDHMLG